MTLSIGSHDKSNMTIMKPNHHKKLSELITLLNLNFVN